MPELPEVETIRRVLAPQLLGAVIERVNARRPAVIAHPGAEAFCASLAGRRFAAAERRGKFLLFRLEGGARLVLHLRMTGCLLLTPPAFPEEKHTHLVFYLRDGRELRFSDQRRFGRWWLLAPGEKDVYSGVEKLGIEPFDPALTARYLADRLGRRKRAVKDCLLDQRIVAGIGNIYSDEILFAAGLDPARSAASLTEADWQRLAAAIPQRLAYFMEKNAIPPEEYLRAKGKEYRNTPFLQVYGHGGEPCPACGAALRRTVIGGRSSVYCPVCQK